MLERELIYSEINSIPSFTLTFQQFDEFKKIVRQCRSDDGNFLAYHKRLKSEFLRNRVIPVEQTKNIIFFLDTIESLLSWLKQITNSHEKYSEDRNITLKTILSQILLPDELPVIHIDPFSDTNVTTEGPYLLAKKRLEFIINSSFVAQTIYGYYQEAVSGLDSIYAALMDDRKPSEEANHLAKVIVQDQEEVRFQRKEHIRKLIAIRLEEIKVVLEKHIYESSKIFNCYAHDPLRNHFDMIRDDYYENDHERIFPRDIAVQVRGCINKNPNFKKAIERYNAIRKLQDHFESNENHESLRELFEQLHHDLGEDPILNDFEHYLFLGHAESKKFMDAMLEKIMNLPIPQLNQEEQTRLSKLAATCRPLRSIEGFQGFVKALNSKNYSEDLRIDTKKLLAILDFLKRIESLIPHLIETINFEVKTMGKKEASSDDITPIMIKLFKNFPKNKLEELKFKFDALCSFFGVNTNNKSIFSLPGKVEYLFITFRGTLQETLIDLQKEEEQKMLNEVLLVSDGDEGSSSISKKELVIHEVCTALLQENDHEGVFYPVISVDPYYSQKLYSYKQSCKIYKDELSATITDLLKDSGKHHLVKNTDGIIRTIESDVHDKKTRELKKFVKDHSEMRILLDKYQSASVLKNIVSGAQAKENPTLAIQSFHDELKQQEKILKKSEDPPSTKFFKIILTISTLGLAYDAIWKTKGDKFVTKMYDKFNSLFPSKEKTNVAPAQQTLGIQRQRRL